MRVVMLVLVMFMAGCQSTGDTLYSDGMNALGRGDVVTGIRNFEPLAKQGHAPSQMFLGLSLTGMWATNPQPIDCVSGVGWLQRSAMAGHRDAMYIMGKMRMMGVCGEPNQEEAVTHFRYAAEHGDERSNDMLRALGLPPVHPNPELVRSHNEAYQQPTPGSREHQDRVNSAAGSLGRILF